MSTLIDVTVPLLTFLTLLAVGLDLTPGDFTRLRRQPALVVAGLIGPLVLLPLIAWALATLWRAGPDLTAAILLVAICPTGAISNTCSYLARASTALAVTLTGLSCLLAGVTMPVMGQVLGPLLPANAATALHVPSVIGGLLLMLTLPVGFGMVVRHHWTGWAMRHRQMVQNLAFVCLALVLVLVILDDPQAFAAELTTTVPLATVFIICSTMAGWATAALLSTDPRDRITLGIEFGARNLGVAMAVAVTVLGRVEFARFAYIYFLAELPVLLLAVVWFRRRQLAIVQVH